MSNIRLLRNIIENVIKSNEDKDIVKYWLKEANKNHNIMHNIHKFFDPDFPNYRNFDDFHKEHEYIRELDGADSIKPIQEFDFGNVMATTLDDPNDFPFGMFDYVLDRNLNNYKQVKEFLPEDYVDTYDKNPLVKAILEKSLKE